MAALDFFNGFLPQKYLAVTQVTSSSEATELGASLAVHFAKEISLGERNLSGIFRLHTYVHGELTHFSEGSLPAISIWKLDRAKALASQIASRSYFSGEIAGLRLSRCTG